MSHFQDAFFSVAKQHLSNGNKFFFTFIVLQMKLLPYERFCTSKFVKPEQKATSKWYFASRLVFGLLNCLMYSFLARKETLFENA